MNIDHVSFSPIGGAGLVASNLAEAQASMGHSARLLSTIDSDLHRQPTAHPTLTMAAAIDRYLVQSDRGAPQFSLYRSTLEVGTRPAIRDNSIVHLHWTNGVMKSSTIKALLMQGRPVVWTLHDMNPFTGGCHHAGFCEEFTSDCSECPQVRSKFRKAIPLELSVKKLPVAMKNLTIVTPSEWLRTRALSSSVFGQQNILTIRNPISSIFFEERDRASLRKTMGFDSKTFVALCVASNLSDPNKNIRLAVESLEELATRISRKLVLLLVGQKGNSYNSRTIEISHLGPLDVADLAKIYTASDLLLSTSKFESAGMTVVESAACGTPSLVLNNGGGEEFARDKESAVLVNSEAEFALGLEKFIKGELNIGQMSTSARQSANRHKSSLIAKSYLAAYSNLWASR